MKTICGRCSFNDGSVYTSLPPKVKCMLTGKFHFMSDPCEIDFSKIDDEKGNWHVNKPLRDNEDIVEVVRCKDCIYYGDHGDGEMACAMMILYPNKSTDYCSLGERRKNE